MQTIDAVNRTILLAIELSASTWLVAARMPGSEKPHLHRTDGGDTAALLALISSLRARAARSLDTTIGVVCCFEAGRDGFWLHRVLTAHGIVYHVLEPTSVLVNRRARRAKTDGSMPRACCACWRPISGVIAKPAAWYVCRRPKRKMPSARTASARTWCGRGCASKTVLKRCCSPRAFGKDLLFVHGSAILLSCAPVMDARYRAIFGPNWIACVRRLVMTLELIAIVAMARKLLIALWRYAETGVIPAGAEIRAETTVAA